MNLLAINDYIKLAGGGKRKAATLRSKKGKGKKQGSCRDGSSTGNTVPILW